MSDRGIGAETQAGRRGDRPDSAGGNGRGVGWTARLWLGGAVVLLMLVLILQNQEPVVTHILFWRFEAPLFLLLSLVGGLGLLAGYFLGRLGRRRS